MCNSVGYPSAANYQTPLHKTPPRHHFLAMRRDRDKIIRKRFDRQFQRIARFVPGMAVLRRPGWVLARVIAALIFIMGGFLAILPVFGLWMIPLGLLLLSIDIPALQGPVTSAIIRGRRRIDGIRRRWISRRTL